MESVHYVSHYKEKTLLSTYPHADVESVHHKPSLLHIFYAYYYCNWYSW